MDPIDEVGRGGSTCTGEERAPVSLLVGGGEAADGLRRRKARVCRRVAACLLTRHGAREKGLDLQRCRRRAAPASRWWRRRTNGRSRRWRGSN